VNLNIALWVVQVILASIFLMTGLMKAFQPVRAKAKLHSLQELGSRTRLEQENDWPICTVMY